MLQVGSLYDKKLNNILSLNDKLTLRQTASVIYNSNLFVGQISGLMHMARAVGTRSVIAYSNAEPNYFVDYPCNINVFSKAECKKCSENKQNPYFDICRNKYECTQNISIENMYNAVEKLLAAENSQEYYEVEPTKVTCNFADYYLRQKVTNNVIKKLYKRITRITCQN